MKISFIGSGNVATALGLALKSSNHEILQVYSRNLENAVQLTQELSAKAINDLSRLDDGADVYILAVPDDVIAPLAVNFPFKNKLIIHTSGTVDIAVLKAASSLNGVLYPIQTISRNKVIDFRMVPLAVEGSTDGVLHVLTDMARSVSDRVLELDSPRRKVLHLAAVFACNFSNHFYAIAEKILANEGLSFDLIQPLIVETATKTQILSPAEAQTGPAARRDFNTISQHLEYLSNSPDLKSLYQLITQSIIDSRKSK